MINQRTINYPLTLDCEVTVSISDDGVVDIDSVVAVRHSFGEVVRASIPIEALSAKHEDEIAEEALGDRDAERDDADEQRAIDREDMEDRDA